MKRSKRYKEEAKKVDAAKIYPLAEAMKLAKAKTTKFDGSVEVHVRLGIDISKTEQQVRGAITLPHGTGKTLKVAAIVSADKAKDAKEAGADLVGAEELIEEIKKSGKIDADVVVATPDMMPKMAAVAKVLGPKGLMPSPKNGTIAVNLAKTIGEIKKGKVNFKSDDTGNIHQVIGKTSFTEQQLLDNYTALLEAVKKAKPSSSKGTYLKNITLASSMGPGIRVEIA